MYNETKIADLSHFCILYCQAGKLVEILSYQNFRIKNWKQKNEQNRANKEKGSPRQIVVAGNIWKMTDHNP